MRLATSLGLSDGIPVSGVTPFLNTYSLDFDGVDDYVDCGTGIGDSLGDNYTGDLSLSMWFKADLTSGNDGFFTIGDFSSSVGEFTIYIYLNEIYYRLNNGGWTRKVAFTDTSSWHHLLIIYKSGSEANSKMFLDGSEVGATSGSFPATSAMDFAGLKTIIGAYYTNAFGWSGLIDEVAIWSNDQTANAATIYGGGTPTDLTSLSPVAWWRNGDSGTFFASEWDIPDQMKIDNFSSYSMAFDGVDDYITIANNTTIARTQNIAYSIWVNLPSTARQYFVGNWSSSNGGAGLSIDTGDILIFQLADGTNDSWYNSRVTSFSTYAPADTWTHIVGTWDGTDAKIYINGILRNTWTPTLPYTISSWQTFWIARRKASTTEFTVTGKLDDIAMWDSGLDANTVISIYNSGKPNDLTLAASYTTGGGTDKSGDLQGYWKFDDALYDGSTTEFNVPDSSTNSNDGTSANMDEVDKINNAPDNTSQGRSVNMDEVDRVTDVPA